MMGMLARLRSLLQCSCGQRSIQPRYHINLCLSFASFLPGIFSRDSVLSSVLLRFINPSHRSIGRLHTSLILHIAWLSANSSFNIIVLYPRVPKYIQHILRSQTPRHLGLGARAPNPLVIQSRWDSQTTSCYPSQWRSSPRRGNRRS